MSLLEEAHEAGPSGPSHLPAQAPPPIPSYTARRAINDIETELVVQTFDDRVLVIVTQSGKVGCLTQASLPDVHPLLPPPETVEPDADTRLTALPPPPGSIQLSPLLGAPPNAPMHDLYVSQIATLVWWALQLGGAARRNVVVGLALKFEAVSEERERFAGIMQMVAGWPGP